MNELPPLAPNEAGQVSLALFDFDGTITTGDSFTAMLRHEKGDWRVMLGILSWSPWLVGYALGFVSRTAIKTRVLRWAFAGMTKDEIEGISRRFAEQQLPALLRADAMRRLVEHRDRGDRVVVVSASPEEWVGPWCRSMGIECICSRLAYDLRGRFAGHLIGLNCRGVEKVRRIRQSIQLDQYPVRYAYGDTKGDLPMLGLAQYRGYRVFHAQGPDSG